MRELWAAVEAMLVEQLRVHLEDDRANGDGAARGAGGNGVGGAGPRRTAFGNLADDGLGGGDPDGDDDQYHAARDAAPVMPPLPAPACLPARLPSHSIS